MSNPKLEAIPDIRCTYGNSPHWDEKTQTLLFVDVMQSTIHRWNPITMKTSTMKIPEPSIAAVVPREKGGLMLAGGSHFSIFLEETKEFYRVKAKDGDLFRNHFKHGKCDFKGRFWAGSSLLRPPENTEESVGSLYCLDGGLLTFNKELFPVESNGLSWSNDGQTMFHSEQNTIIAYDYNNLTGKISNGKIVITFKEADGKPCGHTVDNQGYMWVAMLKSGKIIRVDPQRGVTAGFLKLDEVVKQVTSVCFGGQNYDELFVTSIMDSVPERRVGFSGRVFRVSGIGYKGLPAKTYRDDPPGKSQK